MSFRSSALPLLCLSLAVLAADATLYAALQVFAGPDNTCIILTGGASKCWGLGGDGENGQENSQNYGSSSTTTDIPAISWGGQLTVQSMAVGSSHTCALLSNSKVKCVGLSSYGQLGYESTNRMGNVQYSMGAYLPYVNVGPAIAIAAGSEHTCTQGVFGRWCCGASSPPTTCAGSRWDLNPGTDLSIACWGNGNYGQLANGQTAIVGASAGTMGNSLVLSDVGGVMTQMSLGRDYSCFIVQSGDARCYGRNSQGQLGQGDADERGQNATYLGNHLPRIDVGPRKFASIAAGSDITCGVLNTTETVCWGNLVDGVVGNSSGQMGTNLSPIVWGPGLHATSLSISKSLTISTNAVCALLSDSTIKCFGKGSAFGARLGSSCPLLH
jgi:alpha-tubulin suppressor-like RCC1 family protein